MYNVQIYKQMYNIIINIKQMIKNCSSRAKTAFYLLLYDIY